MVSTDESAYPDEVPSEPDFPLGERPLWEYLHHWASEAPDRPAIEFHGRTVTYGELDAAVENFAACLADRGYGAGDTLMLFLQNCPQFYVGYHAAHRLGMRVSPCSPMSKEHRVSYQLEDGDVEVVLALDAYADVLDGVREDSPVEDVFYTRLESYLPDDPVPPLHEELVAAEAGERQPTDDHTVYLADALASSGTPPEPPAQSMDDVILLQYTSGTTGLPKGCQHTYGTVLYKAASNAAVMNADRETRILEVMPIFHVAGKLFAVDTPLIYGSSVVLLARYGAEAVLTAVDAEAPTTGWLTTPMVRELLGHDDRDEYDLASFEHNPATSFGQALTEELCERWEDVTGASMYEAAYGLSETHTMDTFTRGLGTVEEGFVGRPSHGVDIVVRDWDTHEELPRGEQGEISVTSPSVMNGYWNKPEETEEAMLDGYVLTGDIGRMTEEGFLYFLGRRKSMIKSSGYSVAPAEVEQILKSHDAIDNAVVVGREHESRGEEVVAFVTLTPEATGEDVTGEALVEWASEEMAAYKRPREVRIVDELPTTDVGKLDRQNLEERA
jgi:long-chain acyl-CoA synthetase